MDDSATLQIYTESFTQDVGNRLLTSAYNTGASVDYGLSLSSMQNAMSGRVDPDAINLGAYFTAVTSLDYAEGIKRQAVPFDYKLTTTEIEALAIPEEQRKYSTAYNMDYFQFFMCTFAREHAIMQAASQFLVDEALAGRKNFLWHNLMPKAWNTDIVKNAMFDMARLVNMYLNVCEFVPIAIDPTALAYSRDPFGYWMRNYNWHSGTLEKIGARVVAPEEIKSIKPWSHINGGRVHLAVELKNSNSVEVVVCYVRGEVGVLDDGKMRNRFTDVMIDWMSGTSMVSSVKQSYIMSTTVHFTRDPKSTTAPGAIKPYITNGEKMEGTAEGQFNLMGATSYTGDQQVDMMFPGLEAAKHRDDEIMKAMQYETDVMYESSVRSVSEKRKNIERCGTLEQRVVSRVNLEQANANIYPPPERASTLANYKREIVATPPSSYSIDSHIQRVNASIAILWGLNLTFLQGDSKVYQGVIDKNTKNVTAKITKTRMEISHFFTFLYDCIWKKYDEDHLDYVKRALLSTTIDPALLGDLSDEEEKRITFEGAKLITQLVVALDDLRHDTAFSVEYKLPVYSSTTEVINSGATAIAAGIKQPEQIEAEVDLLQEAQTGGIVE